jgi:hypothetical protein
VYSKTRPYIQPEGLPGPGSYKVQSFVERLIDRVRSSAGVNTSLSLRAPDIRDKKRLRFMCKAAHTYSMIESIKESRMIPGVGEYSIVNNTGINPLGSYFYSKL